MTDGLTSLLGYLDVLVDVVLEVLDGQTLPVEEHLHAAGSGGDIKRSEHVGEIEEQGLGDGAGRSRVFLAPLSQCRSRGR